jgi:hypothetical protein
VGADDELSRSRHVVLVLRLVLDGHAQLRYGELLDGGAVQQGRFGSVDELMETLRQWLERQQRDHVPAARGRP